MCGTYSINAQNINFVLRTNYMNWRKKYVCFVSSNNLSSNRTNMFILWVDIICLVPTNSLFCEFVEFVPQVYATKIYKLDLKVWIKIHPNIVKWNFYCQRSNAAIEIWFDARFKNYNFFKIINNFACEWHHLFCLYLHARKGINSMICRSGR
jgi:hypothetical protein